MEVSVWLVNTDKTENIGNNNMMIIIILEMLPELYKAIWPKEKIPLQYLIMI